MGSQHNSSQELHKNIKTKSKNSQSKSSFSNSSINYSSNFSKSNSSSTNEKKINKKLIEEENLTQEEIKIPTIFEWKEGGKNVLITGSFCNWAHQFAMNKNNNNNNFELLLYLPKGIFQFKFIVDGNWNCSNYYEIVFDENNNANNQIDNTKIMNDKINKNKKNNSNVSFNNNKIKTRSSSKNISNVEYNKKNYGNYFPNSYNFKIPILPSFFNYKMNVNFNTNQNFLGNSKFLNVNDEKNLYSYDYKNITIPKHIFINHLFMNCNNNNINNLNKKEKLNEENNKNNENFSFLCVPENNNNNIEPECNNKNKKKYINITTTMRVRSKFTTIVYIKPLKF